MTQEKKTILIVDDEKSILDLLKETFTNEDIEVIRALNGKEGLKLALEKQPDLILLDIIMPEMGGLTMLRELRKNEWGKNARVIILSNLSNNEKIAEAVAEGAYDYLVKTECSMDDVVQKAKERLGLK
ncbi:MAG: response regulator [bacterium]|nr:response regulator [bacterium]